MSATGVVQPEDRRKHLEFIQTVIARQAQASSTIKGWLLPLLIALNGFALTENLWTLALLGIAMSLVFAFQDVEYLRTERQFRRLYAGVSRGDVTEAFTMDAFDMSGESQRDPWAERMRLVCSWSVLPFYLSLVLIGICVLLAVLFVS